MFVYELSGCGFELSKKNKKLLNIPKLHISLSFSCSSVIFRYFLLIISGAMNAGVPIIKCSKYILIILPSLVILTENLCTCLYPIPFIQNGQLYMLYFGIYYTECSIICLKGNKEKFNYSFNLSNFVRDCRYYF